MEKEKERTSRRKRAVGAVVTAAMLLLLAGGVTGVSAYLSAQASKVNTVTIGSVNTEIQESFPPVETPEPGKSYTKTVQVTNKKGSDCYVRVRVNFSNEELEAYAEPDYNRGEWKEEGGWWYYTKPLKAGETSSALFTKVQFASGTPRELLESFDVYVEAESFEKGNAADYQEAWNEI